MARPRGGRSIGGWMMTPKMMESAGLVPQGSVNADGSLKEGIEPKAIFDKLTPEQKTEMKGNLREARKDRPEPRATKNSQSRNDKKAEKIISQLRDPQVFGNRVRNLVETLPSGNSKTIVFKKQGDFYETLDARANTKLGMDRIGGFTKGGQGKEKRVNLGGGFVSHGFMRYANEAYQQGYKFKLIGKGSEADMKVLQSAYSRTEKGKTIQQKSTEKRTKTQKTRSKQKEQKLSVTTKSGSKISYNPKNQKELRNAISYMNSEKEIKTLVGKYGDESLKMAWGLTAQGKQNRAQSRSYSRTMKTNKEQQKTERLASILAKQSGFLSKDGNEMTMSKLKETVSSDVLKVYGL